MFILHYPHLNFCLIFASNKWGHWVEGKFFASIYIIFMEYFEGEFMFSHTHICKKVLYFLFLSFTKGEEDESDSMAKV